MLFFIGFVLIVKGFLLGVYYRLKANEDDLNRPSFFNSNVRKYSLLFVIILFFFAGEYLIYDTGLYEYMWFVPLICSISYYFVKEEWRTNLIISKVLNYYKVFKSPLVALDHSEHLSAPIDFMLLQGQFDKKYIKKAKLYLETRIKEGKLKTPKDIPQEAWTVIRCVDKDKIAEDPDNRLSQKKIDYFYEEIIEGKTHKNLKTLLSDMFWNLENALERAFINFSFIAQARPDFTSEEIQLTNATISDPLTKKKEREETIAVFPEVDVRLAQKFGWVKDLSEYLALAALEFSRRYPEHEFSKGIKKQHKYTDEQIFDYAQNWEIIDVSKIRVY